MKKYAVKEMFGPTIQGEGAGQGEVVMFLRFTGCNKWSGRAEDKATSACPFCDTDFVGGEKLTADEIVNKLHELESTKPPGTAYKKIKTVVISGGEPLLQFDSELGDKIVAAGWSIYIETNGSVNIDFKAMANVEHVCCSPKQGPDRTKIHYMDSLKVLHPPVEPERHILKFLNDKQWMHDHGDPEVYIQPVMDQNYAKNLQECLKICYDNPKVRLSIQLHKIIEVQ